MSASSDLILFVQHGGKWSASSAVQCWQDQLIETGFQWNSQEMTQWSNLNAFEHNPWVETNQSTHLATDNLDLKCKALCLIARLLQNRMQCFRMYNRISPAYFFLINEETMNIFLTKNKHFLIFHQVEPPLSFHKTWVPVMDTAHSMMMVNFRVTLCIMTNGNSRSNYHTILDLFDKVEIYFA